MTRVLRGMCHIAHGEACRRPRKRACKGDACGTVGRRCEPLHAALAAGRAGRPSPPWACAPPARLLAAAPLVAGGNPLRTNPLHAGWLREGYALSRGSLRSPFPRGSRPASPAGGCGAAPPPRGQRVGALHSRDASLRDAALVPHGGSPAATRSRRGAMRCAGRLAATLAAPPAILRAAPGLSSLSDPAWGSGLAARPAPRSDPLRASPDASRCSSKRSSKKDERGSSPHAPHAGPHSGAACRGAGRGKSYA